MRGGDGNDSVLGSVTASSVRVEGGPGNDGLGVPGEVTADGGVRPIGTVHPASVWLDGGPGEDNLTYEGQGGPTLVGGDGNDSLTAWRTTDPAEVRGDAGNDRLGIELNPGPVLADAGDGDDRLTLSRSGGDFPRVSGGIIDARAGPGEDEILIGDDGDADRVDCGPGDDQFQQLVLGVSFPPAENRYVNCPIVGARLIPAATMTRSRNAIKLQFTSPQRGRLRISVRSDRARRLGRSRARLRKGRTRVTVRLNTSGRRLFRGRRRRSSR